MRELQCSGRFFHAVTMAAAIMRFWAFYERSLETQPLLTNMANTVRTRFAVRRPIGAERWLS